MTAPFRSEEDSALVRVGQLETENAELEREIEVLRESVGENRNAYVKHLEDAL